MAASVNMAALVAALLLLAGTQARDWVTTMEAAAEDMLPVSPAENVMLVPGGGVGTTAAPVCLQCRCCSRSNPARCATVSCCSSFKCDAAGKCNLVQEKCGCKGCGGAN